MFWCSLAPVGVHASTRPTMKKPFCIRYHLNMFPGTTFSFRLGVPRKLEPPPHSYAPGAAVILHLPSGRRVEHVLCAHILGDLWFCHAGSPKEGESPGLITWLSAVIPI